MFCFSLLEAGRAGIVLFAECRVREVRGVPGRHRALVAAVRYLLLGHRAGVPAVGHLRADRDGLAEPGEVRGAA